MPGTQARLRTGPGDVVRAAGLAALCLSVGGCGRDAPETAPSVNLALEGAASLAGGRGEPQVAVDGRILPEAAPPGPGASVALVDVRDHLVVDLGAVVPVGALLLQADAADVYFVELSTDGSAWVVVWRSAPVAGGVGLHTRTAALPRPLPARFLRVRSTTARSAAVSELQAFPAKPRAWPPLDRSDRAAHRPLWPGLTGDRLRTLFSALAAVMMLAAGWHAAAWRWPPSPGQRRLRRSLLVATAAAALVAWPNFLNFHYYGSVHQWEFFHYFMGAKYLPELGYTRLYTCAVAVDAEDGLDLGGQVVRDLRDNRLVDAEAERQRAAECRSRFTPARWSEFRHDARFFRDAMGREGWFGVRSDHGFNGTPAWAVVGGLLSRLGPASSPLVVSIAAVDIALILASLALIGRGFGLAAACIAAGYFGLNALAPFGWTGGGFLRYDWLFWLVGGVAALRGGRRTLAGFALGYASLLRVFPACALAGLVLQALVEAASTRSRRPLARQAPVALGVGAAVVLFGGASIVMAGGPAIWREFAVNSAKHHATATTNLIGLQAFLSYEHEGRLELMTDPLLLDRHEPWKVRRAAAERRSRPGHWLAASLFVVLLAVAVRRAPDWAAAVLGLGLMPVLFVLSSYYYSGYLLFAAFAAVVPGIAFALAVLAWATNVIPGLWPSPDAQYAVHSLAVVVFVMGVTGVLAWASSRGRGVWDADLPEGRPRVDDAAVAMRKCAP